MDGLDLKRWWKDVFGVEVGMLEVANAATFEGLGVLAVRLLQQKLVN